MLSSPAKRRKTSETTSVPVDNSTNDNGDHVSRPSTPRRASYLSPTKASLARSHPHLAAQSNERRSRSQPRDVIAQNFIPPPVVPKLVPRFEGSTPSRERSPPQRNQPNLPPTPVDLGWDDPPDRPRGLFSSSPRVSSRGSGSGRRRRQTRDNHPVTSSPLKPRDPPPPVGERMGGQKDGADMAEEEEEAQVGHDRAHIDDEGDDEPTELRQKRDELHRLRERFRSLKESTTRLGQAVNANALLDGALDNEAVSASLIARLKSRASSHHHHDDDASFEELITTETEADKYLNLFAPGGLQLAVESSTEEKEDDGHPRVVYHLTASAPPPWPASLFTASLDVVTNAETAALLDWVNACLKSDLQGRNAAILLWGMGQYFDKAVRRARAFWRLTTRYRHGNSNPDRNEEVTDTTATTPEAQFGNEEDGRGGGVPTKKRVQPKLMVTWNIDLDWTGVARNRCDIVPSGIPEGAVPAVKEVFARLVAAQGFQRAFDAVYDLVCRAGDSNNKVVMSVSKSGDGNDALAKAGSTKRRKKKKRFT
ncbi:hypothetical protein DV738_g5259, partial [Chaetothyriales sp. CBS 135597]